MYLVDTAEMPAWTSEEEAPDCKHSWGVYTSLGAFRPYWHTANLVPVGKRIEHQARHNVRLRWGQVRRWAGNSTREAREFLFGAFQPIRDAI